jgi:outer membrane protein insertion porin family
MAYELTHENIHGISSSAPTEIKDQKGTSLTSSMTPSLSYDSRDHFFTPTEGTRSGFGVKFAGLGGDTRFIKSDINARWHYPLLKDPNWGGAYVLALGGSLGYGFGFAQDDLPLFERYFIGGINSIRGFTDRSIGPRSAGSCLGKNTGDSQPIPPTGGCSSLAGDTYTKVDGDIIGGNKAAVFNAELLFPIAEQYGLRGVAFFDMGNSFSNGFNFGEFRRSVGIGARWMSPFGPLRVELGFPLSKQPNDETSVLGFSIGSQP